MGTAVVVAMRNLSTTTGTKFHEGVHNFETFVQLRVLRGYCPLFRAGAVDKAPDAIVPMYNIEVYKQSDGFATQLGVRKDLGLMDGRYYGAAGEALNSMLCT